MNTQKRNNLGKRAGLVGIIANLTLATGKLVVGILSASISIIADAVNNFSDGISSVVAMIGFKLAQKPADSDHPFGHARFEYVSGLIVSILVIIVGVELAKNSIEKLITPEPIQFSLITAIVLIIAILVKTFLAVYNGTIGKKIDSETIKAMSVDCRNDVIITSIVLVSMLIEHYLQISVDAYMSLLVSVFIVYSGIKFTKETVSPILGKKNNSELKQKILDKIKEYPIIINYHDLMIHDYGPGISFCSIHFEIDKNHDPLYVHEIIDKFEREFAATGVNLTVHYDPVVTDSKELNDLKHAIVSALVKFDARLTVHDFRIIPCDGFKKVFFDLPLPEQLQPKKKEIEDLIDCVLNQNPTENYKAIITFDSSDFN